MLYRLDVAMDGGYDTVCTDNCDEVNGSGAAYCHYTKQKTINDEITFAKNMLLNNILL